MTGAEATRRSIPFRYTKRDMTTMVTFVSDGLCAALTRITRASFLRWSKVVRDQGVGNDIGSLGLDLAPEHGVFSSGISNAVQTPWCCEACGFKSVVMLGIAHYGSALSTQSATESSVPSKRSPCTPGHLLTASQHNCDDRAENTTAK